MIRPSSLILSLCSGSDRNEVQTEALYPHGTEKDRDKFYAGGSILLTILLSALAWPCPPDPRGGGSQLMVTMGQRDGVAWAGGLDLG